MLFSTEVFQLEMEKERYNHIVILNQPPRYWAQVAAYITKWETSTDDVPLMEEHINHRLWSNCQKKFEDEHKPSF